MVRGKHGWLFLTRDTNEVLRQHSGDLTFSDDDLDRWRKTLETRLERLEELGASYHFLVSPNKESVYPEELPEEIPTAPERPVERLRANVRAAGLGLEILYPVEELVAAKREGEVYSRTDTHWSALGALVGYACLAADIERRFPIPVVGRGDVAFVEFPMDGDLGSKLDPPERGPRMLAKMKQPRARVVHDNAVRNTGRTIVFARDGLDTRCVVFGDSSTASLLIYLAESFGRVVFVHRSTVDYELLREERPDVVVSTNIERFMIRVPDDDAAPSTRQMESEKVARGVVLPDSHVAGFASRFLTDARARAGREQRPAAERRVS